MDGFQSKWFFPKCVGAIDGSHIPIIVPKENPVDNFNRKGYRLIILHDAQVLANSSLCNKCGSDEHLPKWATTIGNATVPLVFWGDPAYPLRSWLLLSRSQTLA